MKSTLIDGIKQFLLLLAGVFMTLAVTARQDYFIKSLPATICTTVLLLCLYFKLDWVILGLKNLARLLLKKALFIAIYAPVDIDSGTSSWVNISLRQMANTISVATKRYRIIKSDRYFWLFPVIINPYGGAYPESDLSDSRSLEQILDYVKNGGIYVNVADIPFYYAFSPETGRMVDTTPRVSGSILRFFYDAIVATKINTNVFNTAEIITDRYYNQQVLRAFEKNKGIEIIGEEFSVDLPVDYQFNKNGQIVGLSTRHTTLAPQVRVNYGKGSFIFSSLEIRNEEDLEIIKDLMEIIKKQI